MFWKKKNKKADVGHTIDPDAIWVIREISSKRFASVTELGENGDEKIIAKSGCVNFTADDHVTIISDGTETFRCTVESVRASLLMSGNGVRIEGYDDEGNKHKVIGIFTKMN